MHLVELMEQATAAAEELGYGLRQENLGGAGGGGCQIAGKSWIFIDLTQGLAEQLGQVLDVLRADPGIHTLTVPPELGYALGLRRAA